MMAWFSFSDKPLIFTKKVIKMLALRKGVMYNILALRGVLIPYI
jgi:hypothetical protein